MRFSAFMVMLEKIISKVKNYILLALFCFLLPYRILAQEIQKSTTFVQLFGTKYYLHTVKDGETLSAIANAYGVTVSEIERQNKDKVGKIESGVLLKIPVMASNSTPGYTQQFVYHTVAKKESLYSICKQYSTTEENIYQHNPAAKNGLQAGMVLKIPVGNAIQPDKQDTEFYYHTAKQNETLFSMSNHYGVEIEDIMRYNPSLRNGLRPGIIVKIPKNNYKTENNDNDENQNVVENTEEAARTRARLKSDYTPCESYYYRRGTPIKVALMLPLFINDNYQLSEDLRQSPSKGQLYKNSEKIYEFYEGVMMAVRDLQQQGKTIELYVYDTENSYAKTGEILSQSTLKTVDLIIGPLYTDNVVRAANFANDNQIALVSPFAQKRDILLNNPYVFQVNPQNATAIVSVADYFANMPNASLVVIHNGTPEEETVIKSYRQNLANSYFAERNVSELPFKEVNYRNGGISRVQEAMAPNKTNIILMPSTKEEFITKVINELTVLQKNNKYDIVLYGSQNWERYSNLDVEFLQSMNFHYNTTNYVNYSNETVKNFVNEFRNRFNVEPSVYGFTGYDVAKYFIGEVARHGKYFEFCVGGKYEGLSTRFDFKRVSENGGFENNSTFILKYNSDFELEQMNK